MPELSASRNYRHSGTPEEPTPAEIVAGLHAEIAAKSPEHARLVVAFERKQEEKARQLLARELRRAAAKAGTPS